MPAFILFLIAFAPTQAAQRPGAVRTIQIRWDEPIPGALMSPNIRKLSITRAVFGVGQPGARQSGGLNSWRLFFTVEANGTRNLWQAVPEFLSPDTSMNGDRNGSGPNLRNVIWRATPLTRLSVPFFADEAAPTPDGRAVLFVTNANLRNTRTTTATSDARQIARLELASGRMTAVTNSVGHHTSPNVAPGGQRFAYVSDRSGMESVYIMPLGGGTARRVATLARNPVWLDDSTLLFESTRPGQSGLYQLSFGRALANDNAWASLPRARQLFSRPGEATVTQDRRTLCVAAGAGDTPVSAGGSNRQLFMLAPDGSGARAVVGTAGARSPSFSPDGQLLVFDAPAPQDAPAEASGALTNSMESRTLWIMPMLRVLPAAQLLEVRVGQQAQELEVMGTAFAEEVGPLEARLEYSTATDPPRWRLLPVNRPPIHAGVLSTWRPDAPGDWLLRLTVTDAAGDSAQSTLALTWPLPPPVVQEAPPPVFARPNPEDLLPAEPLTVPSEAQTPRPIPSLPLPALPPAPGQGAVPGQNTPTGAPVAKPTPRRTPRVATGSQIPILPLPALPPPPGESSPTAPLVVAPPPRPVATPKASTLPSFPAPTVSSTPPASTPPRSTPVPPVRPPAPPASTPVPRPAPAAPTPPVSTGTDRGSIRVSGTPAVMKVGEKVPVEAVLTNLGQQGWSSQGPGPVRVIYHWVNLDSGTRVRWYIEWLTQSVTPRASLKLSFNLSAPPRPGRYRLTYTLVRLQGEAYEPPPYNARPARWPGEFGATSYIVTVR